MTANEISTNPYFQGNYRGVVSGTSASGRDTDGARVVSEGPARNPSPPYTVSISAKALKAEPGTSLEYGEARSSADSGKTGETAKSSPMECSTCRNRKYKDVSNDATVSFQTPTKLSPGTAESAVRAHEQQHVSHEQAKAAESGAEVTFQSVAIHYSICPECGRSYVTGGTTSTVTRSDDSTYSPELADSAQKSSISIRV